MLTVKIIENNTMYSVQELCLHLFLMKLHSIEFVSASLVSSIFSVHSSTNLFTNFSLHVQFLQSKYSLKSQDLQHQHSQLLGFQINPLSHAPLSINSLQFHLLLSFQRYLLLQTPMLNLHLHLHVSSHSMRLVSLFPETTLNTLTFKFFTTSRTHNFAHGLLILLQLSLHLLVLILKEKKHWIISININNLWSYFTFLIVY